MLMMATLNQTNESSDYDRDCTGAISLAASFFRRGSGNAGGEHELLFISMPRLMSSRMAADLVIPKRSQNS
jgi:hypothetical protein